MRRIGLFIVGLLAVAPAGWAGGATGEDPSAGKAREAAERLPLPADEARAAAEAAVEEAFGDDLKASDDAARIAVAGKLIETAAATDEPASKLVMYERAAALAALAGKAELVSEAARAVAAWFEVDRIDYRHRALTEVQRWARSAEDAGSLAEALLALREEAVGADRFESALRMARQAVSAARLAGSTELRRAARTAERETRQLHAAYQRLKPMLDRLAESPDDAEANEAVGRFYVFTAGQVKRGAAYLAKGADEALAALGEGELSAPEEAAAQAALAGQWWQWAEPRRGAEQTVGLCRAAHWYERALEGVEGLAKRTAEKRLDEYYERFADRQGVVEKGNVALAERGAKAEAPKRAAALIDGNSTRYDGYSGFASGDFPCAFTVDLGKVYRLRRVRVLLWDGNNRHYKYTASVSAGGRRWATVADHADQPSQSWQTIDFRPRPVRYIRVRGLHNTANSGFHIVEIEAYCRVR